MSLPYAAERLLDDAIVGIVFRPELVLASGNSEQQDRLNSERPYPVDLPIEHLVDRELKDRGHRRDLALDCTAVHHKDGLDQVGGRKFVFADKLPDGTGSAPASRSVAEREGHNGRLESGRLARNSGQTLHVVWHVPCPYKERRTPERVFTLSIRRVYRREGHWPAVPSGMQVNA